MNENARKLIELGVPVSVAVLIVEIVGEAAASVVPSTRTISTQHSLTGGGDLSSNRTLSLVNDTASPGNSKYYGTDGSGDRGWFDLPGGASWGDIQGKPVAPYSETPADISAALVAAGLMEEDV